MPSSVLLSYMFLILTEISMRTSGWEAGEQACRALPRSLSLWMGRGPLRWTRSRP